MSNLVFRNIRQVSRLSTAQYIRILSSISIIDSISNSIVAGQTQFEINLPIAPDNTPLKWHRYEMHLTLSYILCIENTDLMITLTILFTDNVNSGKSAQNLSMRYWSYKLKNSPSPYFLYWTNPLKKIKLSTWKFKNYFWNLIIVKRTKNMSIFCKTDVPEVRHLSYWCARGNTSLIHEHFIFTEWREKERTSVFIDKKYYFNTGNSFFIKIEFDKVQWIFFLNWTDEKVRQFTSVTFVR